MEALLQALVLSLLSKQSFHAELPLTLLRTVLRALLLRSPSCSGSASVLATCRILWMQLGQLAWSHLWCLAGGLWSKELQLEKIVRLVSSAWRTCSATWNHRFLPASPS